jgi:hypothetical protein
MRQSSEQSRFLSVAKNFMTILISALFHTASPKINRSMAINQPVETLSQRRYHDFRFCRLDRLR